MLAIGITGNNAAIERLIRGKLHGKGEDFDLVAGQAQRLDRSFEVRKHLRVARRELIDGWHTDMQRLSGSRFRHRQSRHHAEQQARIRDASRDRAKRIESRAKGCNAVQWNTAKARLEPDNPAERRRNADRSAGVGADGRRHQAGCDGNGRPAA